MSVGPIGRLHCTCRFLGEQEPRQQSRYACDRSDDQGLAGREPRSDLNRLHQEQLWRRLAADAKSKGAAADIQLLKARFLAERDVRVQLSNADLPRQGFSHAIGMRIAALRKAPS